MRGPNEFERARDEAVEFVAWCAIQFWHGLVWVWSLTPDSWPWWQRAGLLLLVWMVLLPFTIRVLVPRLVRWIKGGPQVFGQARFARLKDLRAAGMLKPGGRFLGVFARRIVPLWWDRHMLFVHGEGHCLTIAAQGGGKTTGLVIPTLITYRTGTVIVTDPKGAITAQTRRLRSEFSRVVVLNPWHAELPAGWQGDRIGDDGCNPLQLIVDGPEGQDMAGKIAALLLPDAPRGRDNYFQREGRALLKWGMLYLALNAPPAMRTLPNLRSLLYDMAGLTKILENLAKADPGREAKAGRDSPAWRTLREEASRFFGMITLGAGGQIMGIIGSATAALDIYAGGTRLSEHVSKDGFRLADLKGPELLTVYVICPPDHLVSDDRNWLNLMIALITTAIGRPGAARETVLLVDEFPALGPLPVLQNGLEQFREAGMRAQLIAQNVGQILTIYGPEGLRRFWGGCEIKQFFNVTDPEQARLLSDWLGQRQVENPNVNARGEQSIGLVGVPLFRPEELMTMPKDRQVIVRQGLPPILAQVVPYYRVKAWADLVDPNPFRDSGRTAGPLPPGAVPIEAWTPEPSPAAPAPKAQPAPVVALDAARSPEPDPADAAEEDVPAPVVKQKPKRARKTAAKTASKEQGL